MILLDGKYQLPIYCQEPLRKKPFNMESMLIFFLNFYLNLNNDKIHSGSS